MACGLWVTQQARTVEWFAEDGGLRRENGECSPAGSCAPAPQDRRADAVWLAELCECGLPRPSFVPSPMTAQLAGPTRDRKRRLGAATARSRTVR